MMRLAILVSALVFSCFAHGEEIRVLSGGAARGFVEPLAKSFRHPVKLEYQTMGHLVKTLASADAPRYDMVIVTTGTSGKYVVEMFRKLNILEQMKGKTTLVDAGYAVAPVGRGEVELGIHQISEILPVKGVRLAAAGYSPAD